MENKATVLVVDDEPDVRALLSEVLAEKGLNAICAETGKGLIERIESVVPDLIVLDLLLPGEHGLDLAVTIKQRFYIPIIVVSGVYRAHEIMPQLETTRIEGFLEKPIDLKKFVELVGQILG